MKFVISLSPIRIAKTLAIVASCFTFVSIVLQYARYVFNYRQEWTNLFNLDKELNYPTWYQSFTLLFCAILLAIIAAAKKVDSDRYFGHWKALSFIFLFLALDETISIHEILIIPDLRSVLHLGGIFYYIWVIPGAIFVLIFAKSYLNFLTNLPRKSRCLFFLSGLIYVGGALGMEMIGGYYADLYGQRNLGYALITNAEEFLEMMGIVIFSYALMSYMNLYMQSFDIQLNIFNHPDSTNSRQGVD